MQRVEVARFEVQIYGLAKVTSSRRPLKVFFVLPKFMFLISFFFGKCAKMFQKSMFVSFIVPRVVVRRFQLKIFGFTKETSS